MNFKNKTVQKTLACLLILATVAPAIFLAFPTKTADAQFAAVVTDIVDSVPTVVRFIEEHIGDIIKQMLMEVARRLVDKITQSTVDWINSGFHGAPLFVQNPGSFFNDIAKTELKGFINDVAYDPVKYPFGKNYALGLVNQYQNQFQQNAQYSLSKVYTDQAQLDYQMNNFSAQGWNGLLLNTQIPQNNFLGFDFLSSNELASKLTGPNSTTQQTKDKLAQGLGFLSQEACASNPDWDPDKLKEGAPDVPYHPPADNCPVGDQQCEDIWNASMDAYNDQYNQQVQQGKDAFNLKYSCPEGPSTTTPGSSIGSQVSRSLQSKGVQTELAAALGNSLGAIFDALLNKLFQTGLSKLTGFLQPQDPGSVNVSDYGVYGSLNGQTNGSPTLGSPPTSATELVVSLNITNDNGGTLTQAGVTLAVDGNTVQPGVAALVTGNIPHTVTATGSQTSQTSYNLSYSGDCDSSGNVVVASGTTGFCTVTLDDIAHSDLFGASGMLTVTTSGITLQGGIYVQGLVNGNPVSPVAIQYAPGTYTVSGSNYSGYTQTIGGDCAADGTIAIADGDNKACTVNYIQSGGVGAPVGTTGDAILIIRTVVVNDDGGNLSPAAVTVFANGTQLSANTTNSVAAGTYVVSAGAQSGYNAAYGGDCAADGTITLAAGNSKTCTVSEDDAQTAVQNNIARLTVQTAVINHGHGGTLTPGTMPVFVDGAERASGVQYKYNAGQHFVTVSSQPGYSSGWSGDCDASGTVNLLTGNVKTCTVTFEEN